MCLVWKGERESPVKHFVARSERVSQKSLVFEVSFRNKTRGEEVLKISPGKRKGFRSRRDLGYARYNE
jgi:hypothetical protein